MPQAITFPLEGPLRPRVANKVHDKITLADKLAFFRQLNTLFRSGTPLFDALKIASEQTESKKLSQVIQSLAHRISAGESLSDAMAAHEKEFDTEWVFLIKSGEVSGQLEEVLLRLASQIDDAAQFRSKIVSSLMYPAIVMFVSIAAIVVMLTLVVPTFAKMFADMGKELPALTLKVMALSDFLIEQGHTIVAGIAFAVFLMRNWLRTESGGRTWCRMMIATPLLGDLAVQGAMHKISTNLSGLLQSGVPLLDSIDAIRGIFRKNPIYAAAMRRIAQHIGRGGTLTEGMEVTGVFTRFMINMSRVAEESGTMPEVYAEVGAFYRRRVETIATRIASNIEALLIIFMGLAVALILAALYLPLFEMAT